MPFKRLNGAELLDWQREFNTIFSKIRAAVEHAVAKVKTWRMLSREGGRYRCPIGKFESMLEPSPGCSSSPNTVMINELAPGGLFIHRIFGFLRSETLVVGMTESSPQFHRQR